MKAKKSEWNKLFTSKNWMKQTFSILHSHCTDIKTNATADELVILMQIFGQNSGKVPFCFSDLKFIVSGYMLVVKEVQASIWRGVVDWKLSWLGGNSSLIIFWCGNLWTYKCFLDANTIDSMCCANTYTMQRFLKSIYIIIN